MWGDLEEEAEEEVGDLTVESFDASEVGETSPIAFDLQTVGSSGEDEERFVDYSNFLDPRVLHIVELQQFKRCVSNGNEKQNQKVKHLNTKEKIPKLPELRVGISKTEEHLSNLNDSEVYSILRKSVALLAAHIGFQGADAEALETLTEIAVRRLEKITHVYKQCQIRHDLDLECAFEHPIEQTLAICGIPDLRVVSNYYEHWIRRLHERLRIECQKMLDDFSK